MVAHLSEEEQIEAIKKWWKDNGTSTLLLIAVLCGGFFGWNYYKDAKVASAQKASVQFEAFTASVDKLDTLGDDAEDKSMHIETVKNAAKDIIEQQSSGLYADFARLQLAKMSVTDKAYDEAIEYLAMVKNKGANDEMQQLANVRIARVYAAKGDYDQALSVIDSADPSSPYNAQMAETKGDVLMMQGNLEGAAKAYQTAINELGDANQQRISIVQFKLDNTKVASAGTSTPDVQITNPHQSSDEQAEEETDSGSEGA